MQVSAVTLSRLGVNLWKIIWEIYKKIDKMSNVTEELSRKYGEN